MSRLVIAALLLVALGCDDKKMARGPQAGPAVQGEAPAKRADAPAGAAKEPPGAPEAPPDRKIIYNARVELHVASLDEARGKLDVLLAEVKGYVAKSDESGRTGGARFGTWKVRVPVGAFHDFLARVGGFGELVSKTSDAQDVTDEFVDLEARLKNLHAEEAVLNKLLNEPEAAVSEGGCRL